MALTFSDAPRLPVSCGVKVTFIAQLAPAARVLPQVPVSEKSARFPPVICILILLNPAVPRLVKVTVCGLLVVPTDWLPKFRLLGLSPANVPVPFRVTPCNCGAPASPTRRVAARAPSDVGVNVTLMLQLAPCARLAGQLFVWEKSPAFVPLMLAPVSSSGPAPTLVSVVVWGVWLDPTGTVPKERLPGERIAGV